MHPLLTGIFNDYPGKTVYLSLGRYPVVSADHGNVSITKGSVAPLTPERLAGIINALITAKEGRMLKRDYFLETQAADHDYLRKISIQHNETSIDVRIASILWKDVEEERRKNEATARTLKLIKG